jgi:hypothetical protein
MNRQQLKRIVTAAFWAATGVDAANQAVLEFVSVGD